MTPKNFYIQLTVISIIVALLLVLLDTSKLISSHLSLSWISWGFFILFSIGMFYASSKSATSENKNLFGQIFLMSILLKMFFCATMLIVYMLVTKPQTAFFALPFLLVYLVFTIYEVYFVTKLAKP
jgi:hypothetical protein